MKPFDEKNCVRFAFCSPFDECLGSVVEVRTHSFLVKRTSFERRTPKLSNDVFG